MEGIGKKIVSGVAYNTISRVLIVGIQAITSIVLARLLISSDYGIVAFATVFISFLSQFSDFGFGSAIIQRKDISRSALNTAFTVRNAVAFALVICALLISFVVPYFFDYPHIEWVIRLLALNFILSSMGFVSSALLKREMDFLHINIATLAATAAGSLVAVVLAYRGYGFWSIVWANILTAFVQMISYRILKPYSLSYEFNAVAAREMWRFGSYLFISGLMVYALFNGANFLVGVVQGATVLGYFALAFDWGTKVPTVLSWTVLSVLFPAFSKIRDDEEKIKKTYIGTVKYVAFFSIMVNVTLLCIAEDFLKTVLGGGTDKWMPALNCFRILCVYGIVRAILEPLGSVIAAFGETRVLLKANILAAIMQTSLIYPILLYYNVEGVAWLILISYASQYAILLPFLKERAGISPTFFLRAVSEPLLCSATFLLGFFLMKYIAVGTALFDTILKALLCTSLYVVAFGMTTRFQLLYDLKLLARR